MVRVRVRPIDPVNEGNPPTVTRRDVVVELLTDNVIDVQVTYSVAPGGMFPATPSSDYRVPNGETGTLIFPAGSLAGTTRTVTIEVNGDTIAEEDETVMFQLTGIVGGELENSEQVLTIIDDDAVTVSIGPAAVEEGNAGTETQLEFPIFLSNPARERSIRVRYRVEPISATPDVDYRATTPAELVIPPDDSAPVIIVTVIGDDTPEPNETLRVVLEGVIGGSLGEVTSAIGIIIDDDQLPALPKSSRPIGSMEGSKGWNVDQTWRVVNVQSSFSGWSGWRGNRNHRPSSSAIGINASAIRGGQIGLSAK